MTDLIELRDLLGSIRAEYDGQMREALTLIPNSLLLELQQGYESAARLPHADFSAEMVWRIREEIAHRQHAVEPGDIPPVIE